MLDALSDVSVTLILFTIGLKLRLRGPCGPTSGLGPVCTLDGTVVTFGLKLSKPLRDRRPLRDLARARTATGSSDGNGKIAAFQGEDSSESFSLVLFAFGLSLLCVAGFGFKVFG